MGLWVRAVSVAVMLVCLGGCQPDGSEPADAAVPDGEADAEPPCTDGQQRECAFNEACTGIQLCSNGRFGRCMLPPEQCNGVDDDCDGEADEIFSELGEPCGVGQGACRGEGQMVCDPVSGRTVCDASAGPPSDETCNGEDDDCDGATDEEVPPTPCEVGVGACRAEGQRFCDNGEMRCDVEPGPAGPELCNGLDDDCDGTSDEEPTDAGRPCGTGDPGICAPGRLACADGAPTCIAEATPVDEVCNGLDDDCDGLEDEGFDVGLPCAAGRGACLTAGTTVCADDGDSVCDAMPRMPAAEVCNGEDDDCDGLTDEGIGDPEVCNGRDDDCDFEVDEGFEVGAACDVGLGLCAREGLIACTADGDAACDVEPGEARDELCDGEDDDCDGAVDENLGLGAPCEVGLGECAARGVGICGDDGAFVCFADAAEPRPEVCDGLDDDCDGETDENFEVGQPCAVGTGACRAEGARRCTPDGAGALCDAVEGEPSDEVCNGVDDDCDGQTDEGFAVGAPCEVGQGQCADRGVFVCDPTTDAGIACDAVPGDPEDERCDGDDDDCDGRIDEGLELGEACPVGIGACAREGVRVCGEFGSVVCDGEPGPPADEVCNGVDDDCDGVVDENFDLGAACAVGVGACQAEGTTVCGENGDIVCDAAPGAPGSELCNAVDDDCDGEVDEVLNCEVFASCAAALAAGADATGTYLVTDHNGDVRSVWCDQETDGGGWTLVASSRGAPPSDRRMPWTPDLQGPAPAAANDGIWPGLRGVSLRHDVRFVCFADPDAPATVDLSFYAVSWYREFTTGADADCCFSENDGRGADREARIRRDNIGGEVRARGQGRLHADGDWFEGEDACDSADDFAIDFDDRALGGRDDATDWGLFDGVPRCGNGAVGAASRWMLFARPPQGGALGRVGVLGPATLPLALADSGFDVDLLVPSPAIDLAPYDVVVLGRLFDIWALLPEDFPAQVDAFARAGGGIVTEYDATAVMARAYDDDFDFENAPAPWGWMPMTVGAGGFLGLNGLEPTEDAVEDPAVRSLPANVTGRGGPAFFVRPTLDGAVPVRVLTTTAGDDLFGARFASTLRAVRCGANLLLGAGSYGDAAREAGVDQYVRNLVAAAMSPPPALDDLCPDD